MRFALIVVLLLGFVGCNSNPDEVAARSLKNASQPKESAQSNEPAEVKTVAVKVTGMMCTHGCYPQVKSLISKTNNVESIELTPQLKADVIDNPVILVKYRGALDKDATTKALIEAGFEQVEFTAQ